MPRRPPNAPKSPPQISVSASLSGKDGKTINIDANALEHPEVGAAWLVYSATRASWRSELFKKSFPQEKKYRHSLAEEAMSLRMALATFEGKEITDPALSQVAQLDKDGMLEAYVLLTTPDEEIALDYATYRDANREVLRSYVQKYVVKRSPPAR